MKPLASTVKGRLLTLAAVGSVMLAGATAASGSSGTAASYISALGLHPPNVTITGHAGARGGLFFIDPFASSAKPIVGQPGAQILDAQGSTVWFHPVGEGEQAVDFRPQSYERRPVLTWWQGTIAVPPKYTNVPVGSPEPGAHFYVYDEHYRLLKTVSEQEGWTPDLHEFVIERNGDAMFIAAKAVSMDLTPYGGQANGQLEDSAIREVNLKTGKLVFQWDMLAHVPLSEAQVAAPAKGTWDPFHMNSIDLLGHGGLLVSARNTWAIYDVDRNSGKVLWQLGGKGSTFTVSAQASFYWQHDARMLAHNELSMFDDGCCNVIPTGLAPPEQEAHGLILKLDFAKHTATAVHEYRHSPPLRVVPSQGNTQILPGGNVLVGWGQLPFYSEYTATGRQLYDVELPEADESYRALRLGWVGLPLTRPSVVASRAGTRTRVYVSWNGATQVARWEVLAPAHGHTRVLASSRRRGFETAISVNAKVPLIQVKALSAAGRVIGTSVAVHVKAPPSAKTAASFAGANVTSQTVRVSKGAVAVTVSCPASTYKRCTVKLLLKTARAVKLAGRSEIITLGSGSATITPGGSAAIHIRLSSQAQALINSGKGRLQANALTQSRDGHGARASKTRRVTIAAGSSSGGEEPSSAY